MPDQPLYRYRVNTSVTGPHEYVGCFSCQQHARFAAHGRGVSPLVVGEPFTTLGPAGTGVCEECEYTNSVLSLYDRRGISA